MVLRQILWRLLSLPYTVVFRYLRDDKLLTYSILGFTALIVISTAILEFGSSPVAPFQIAPAILQSNSQGQQFLVALQGICDPSHFLFKDKYSEFQSTVAGLVATGSSYTTIAYYTGFVGFTLFHLTLFNIFAAFIYMQKTTIQKYAFLIKDSTFFLFGYAIVLASVWVIFRLTFRFEDSVAFGVRTGYIGDLGIMGLYGLIFVIYLVMFGLGLEKYGQKISMAGQVATVGLGVYLSQTNDAARFFGTHATIANYATLVLVFVGLSFISLLFTVGKVVRKQNL